MKHAHYRGVCCRGFKTSDGRKIAHFVLGRLMLRVETDRWWKPERRRSYFYKAKAFLIGPFVFYWRDKLPKEQS